jgi:hypothetical protein
VTAERQMFVPFSLTRDPAQALLLCRQQGLLRTKIEGMNREDAELLYNTTVVTHATEN